jgi:hypothetical protein
MSDGLGSVPPLARGGHAAHVLRCMMGLPESQTEVDSSRFVGAVRPSGCTLTRLIVFQTRSRLLLSGIPRFIGGAERQDERDGSRILEGMDMGTTDTFVGRSLFHHSDGRADGDLFFCDQRGNGARRSNRART